MVIYQYENRLLHFFLFGVIAFSWKNKLQDVVAASSTEAEYFAQAKAVKDAL